MIPSLSCMISSARMDRQTVYYVNKTQESVLLLCPLQKQKACCAILKHNLIPLTPYVQGYNNSLFSTTFALAKLVV